MANQTKADRAKIFMPFDAVKGFREALAEKERITVSKIELSEEHREELDRRLRMIHPGDIVTVVYFHGGEYVKLTGMVSKFSPAGRTISIVNTKIPLDDIRELENAAWDNY